MEITLYSDFAKRHNSTKQVNTSGVIKNVVLKEKCSVVHPSFFISDVTGYTYLKAWNIYYFIDRILYDINGAQYIECTVDVLGTWKQQILATTAYVEYSTSNYSSQIIDDRVSQLVTKDSTIEVEETMFVGNHTAGCICIMAANNQQGSKAWILSNDDFELLVAKLINAGSSVWQSLLELFGDAVGSIIGARYIPIPYSYFYNKYFYNYRDSIILGDYPTGVGGVFFDGYANEHIELNIPRRYTDFRQCSQFTSYRLCLPFIGQIEILSENLIGYNRITTNCACNCATGSIAYGVWASGDVGVPVKLLGTYSGEFGRQIPITTDQINAVGVIGGSTAATGGLITGVTKNIAEPLALGGYGGGALAVGAILAGIATATIAANKQDFAIIGGYGGGFAETIFNAIYLQEVTNDTRTEPSELATLYGRPCMKVLQLSTLTGYVKTVGFSIDINILGEFRELINNAMDSGVYLE